MSWTVENNWARAFLRVQVTLYEQQVSASVEFIKKHKYTLTSICCALLLKCYRHSGDAELRLGFGGVGVKLLWSVNTKKVQSKQYLTATSILECVFRILKRQTVLQHVYHHIF